MENSLERVLSFEGQEVKVKTDKGIELFNLANSCRVLGITREKKNGTIIVRWDSLKDRLNTILSSANKLEPQYIEELKQLLEDIDETDDRNSLYCSRYLTSRLAMESRNSKAMEYKDWLAKLDESYSNGELQAEMAYKQIGIIANNMNMVSAMITEVGQAFNGVGEFVKDSIRAKDSQIDKIANMIGFRNINVKHVVNTIKQELSKTLHKNITARSQEYQELKQAIFKKYKVFKWEDIPIERYNEVHKFVTTFIENNYLNIQEIGM